MAMYTPPRSSGGVSRLSLPLSADRSSEAILKGRLLLRRSHSPSHASEDPSSLPISPKRPRSGPLPRRTLFPSKKEKSGVLLFSWDKDWRKPQRLRGRLPPSVSVGLRAPWTGQACTLCKVLLPTLKAALLHFTKTHRPRKVLFVCSKCARTYRTAENLSRHTPKCVHKRVVSTGRVVPCLLCPARFSSRGISLHLRSKHPVEYFGGLKGPG